MNTDPTQLAYQWYTAILRGEQPALPGEESGVSLEVLWQVGMSNGVLSLCHHLLSNSALWNDLPEDFKNGLTSHAKQQAALDLFREQELRIAFEQFNKAGLDFMVLKGAALAKTHYPTPYLREREDTDILFPDRQSADQAWAILKGGGYSRPVAIDGEYVTHEFSCYKTSGAGSSNTFDLHWKLSNSQRFARAFTFTELAEREIEIPGYAGHAKTLDPKHALLYGCMHRIAHQPDKLENRLIWLYDIHLLWTTLSQGQQEKMIAVAKDKNLHNLTLDGLIQINLVFRTHIPEHVSEELKQGAAKEAKEGDIGKSLLAMDISNFRELPSLKEKLSLLKEHLFPAPEYMLNKYQTRNRLLLPILYVVRIITGIAKRV